MLISTQTNTTKAIITNRPTNICLKSQIKDLLCEMGPGKQITPSAYDTAWVARLAEIGEPIGEDALEWLRSNQLEDGSWGAA